jgi:hypothetical protein
MAYTLFDASLDLARILMDVFESVSTAAGTTTTLTDSALVEPNGYYSENGGGTIWIKGQSLARRVTGYNNKLLTWSPAVTSLVASGSAYAVAGSAYPLRVLVQAINTALREIGRLPLTEDVTPVAEQAEYTVDDNAVFEHEVVRIQLAQAAAEPYNFMPHYYWEQLHSLPRVLRFQPGYEPLYTYPMRVTYLAEHAGLVDDDDEISPAVHPDRLKWQAAVHALRWMLQRRGQDDPLVVELLNEANRNAAIQAQRRLVRVPAKIRLAGW